MFANLRHILSQLGNDLIWSPEIMILIEAFEDLTAYRGGGSVSDVSGVQAGYLGWQNHIMNCLISATARCCTMAGEGAIRLDHRENPEYDYAEQKQEQEERK
jgi:hypothetical protein